MQFYSDDDLRLLGLEDELNKRKYHIIDDVDDITPNMRRVCIKKTITKSVPSYITHVKTDVALLPGELPEHLEYLEFEQSFNEPVTDLPASLKHLKFGHRFQPRASWELTTFFGTFGIWIGISTKSSPRTYHPLWNTWNLDNFNQELPKNLPRISETFEIWTTILTKSSLKIYHTTLDVFGIWTQFQPRAS